MLALTPPVISLADPLVEGEGSVDPLALDRTYERLADRFLPAVTVRMSRIRFLTAMSLGALVCRELRDRIASDGVTPPWLVFEWHVVEAFARAEDGTRRERIPGLQKVTSCLQNQRPVSAASYLKTPKVFGFTGIFRRLATKAHILDEDLDLDDGAHELLAAWARDEGLAGVVEDKGPGADLVQRARDAVARGLDAGHSVKCPGAFWERLARHLHPGSVGRREGRVLHERLRGTHELTREHVDRLAAGGAFVDRQQEPVYLRRLMRHASPELVQHLAAVDAYEAMCRPIADAFDLLRRLSTARQSGPVDAATFAADSRAAAIVPVLKEACAAAARNPVLLDWQPEVRILIDRFGQVPGPRELFAAVVAHHEAAQKAKPPDGKRPWLERARGDAYMVRPAYALEPLDDPPPAYVHDYRTRTLSGFLADLELVS